MWFMFALKSIHSRHLFYWNIRCFSSYTNSDSLNIMHSSRSTQIKTRKLCSGHWKRKNQQITIIKYHVQAFCMGKYLNELLFFYNLMLVRRVACSLRIIASSHRASKRKNNATLDFSPNLFFLFCFSQDNTNNVDNPTNCSLHYNPRQH